MFLKNYQIKVVSALKQFFQTARETQSGFAAARAAMPTDLRHTLNWVDPVFAKVQKEYKDKCSNGLKEWYPRIVLKVPTGGGKTLLAVEAIREYHNLFAQKRTGLIVWIVPTETIYTQTVRKLRDKSNHLRQLLDQCSGNKTLILEKGQRLTTQDIEENLVILFVMIQSISRVNGKEALKVFQDSGGYESFFPADNRNDLHAALLRQHPNLDYIAPAESAFPLIKTSLGNAIRVARPFIIIDEIHKVSSDTARHTIDNLNPECVLGLSATPKAEMNVLVSISGLELKDEEMVKLDMHILPPAGRKENDWKTMVKEVKGHREALEKKAKTFQRSGGIYIRPLALIQVEATGKDQRGRRDRVHSLDVKDYLADLDVNPDQIAIKTSSQNDIEDVNLFSSECPVRYIITKEALREGWDCSFAYVLGIVPNVNSDTSITQLIGRILRQPNAKKTGVQELDESYVYYAKGEAGKMIERVDAGFRNEGLEDLMSRVKIKDRGEDGKTKTVKIRKEFKKYAGAFYLPVWLVAGNGKSKRRFSYDMDIKALLDFANVDPSKEQITKIAESLSDETRERKGIAITIDQAGHTAARVESTTVSVDEQISIDYLTRRYSEVIENPFFARTTAVRHLDHVRGEIGDEKLREHFSYIASMLHDFIQQEKTRQEEAIFLRSLNDEKLVLAVSDDSEAGYQIPQTDTITVDRMPNIFRYYLFDDVELSAMNSLERHVGQLLDKQEQILWWFRNKASKGWYAIQGWQKHKIRPDFIAAKKVDNGKLELVYVIESKGEHLVGNADSEYKKAVLDFMTDQHKKNRIERYQTKQLELFQINEHIECYFVEENKEDDLRKLFK